ncbi:unnamed protein product, partial [Musa hybrid cultivar]
WLRPTCLGFIHLGELKQVQKRGRGRCADHPSSCCVHRSFWPTWDVSGAAARSTCNETQGRGCRVEEEEEDVEFELDSDINRRLLAGGNRYIVNGALSPDRAVCGSSNGRSYNCNGKSGQTGGGRECGRDYFRC